MKIASDKYKGVYFNDKNGMWLTKIDIDNENLYKEYFYTENKAALAYNIKIKEYEDNPIINNIDNNSKKAIYNKPQENSPYPKRPVFCPYCNCWTIIVRRDSYKRLDCCGISTKDWDVMKQNKLRW